MYGTVEKDRGHDGPGAGAAAEHRPDRRRNQEQKTGEITPFIQLSEYSYKWNKYHINIQATIKDNYDLDKFWISFAFNNEKKTDYPEAIVLILMELARAHKGWLFYRKSESE